METLVKKEIKIINWVTVIYLSWELDETNVDNTFKEIYSEIWDFSGKDILLNLEWLKYMNSKTIWYIAEVLDMVEDSDWFLYISNLWDEVKVILDTVWLSWIIQIFPTEEEAFSNIEN